MTQYSNDLALNVLENALNSPDNNIIAETAKKSLPVIKQAHRMKHLLEILSGKFDDDENNYNQEIDDILRFINQDLEKLEGDKNE